MKKSLSYANLESGNNQIEHEVKIVKKQIAKAEKTLAGLLKDFTNITIDLTRLHTRQEQLCDAMHAISSEESPDIQNCFSLISTHMKILLDSLKLNISLLQSRVVDPISNKAESCKEAREILSKCTDAKKQRNVAIKALLRNSTGGNQDNDNNTKTILESTKQLNALTAEMISFEKSQVEDLKLLLKTYMHSNLAYHVKAVEQYTKAYQTISLLDVDKHVEHFLNSLKFPEKERRTNFVKWHSLTSLDNTNYSR